MKLFTFPASPGCRPIAMFIADHGMDVEEHVVDLMSGQQYSPEFIAINPNGAVPVLQDGDFVLTESSAKYPRRSSPRSLVIGCNFSAWPNVRQWSERMEALPNWRSANAGLYEWAKFTKTQEYVRV